MPIWGLAVDLGFVLHREPLAGQKRSGHNLAEQVLDLPWIVRPVLKPLADLTLVPLRHKVGQSRSMHAGPPISSSPPGMVPNKAKIFSAIPFFR